MSDLLRGIGVIIDDQIFAKSDEDVIKKIKKKIEDSGIPLVLYDKLPSLDTLKHLNSASFFILDWKLDPVTASSENEMPVVSSGSQLTQQIRESVIKFLVKIRDECFAPVFIFSNESSEDIKNVLKSNGVWTGCAGEDFILVKGKTQFKVVKTVENWIKRTPSVYVSHKCRKAFIDAQGKMFADLRSKHPFWPSILWKGYKDDGDSPAHAMRDLLLRNLVGRLASFEMDETAVLKARHKSASSDVKKIVESAILIPKDSLPQRSAGCGDIFKKDNEYLLNIRCDCDCVPREGNEHPTLYLLRGNAFEKQKGENPFNKKYGIVQIRNNCHYLYPVDGGAAVKFFFSEITQKSLQKLEKNGFSRIGRLTAPHLTDIRQRFAQWLQREAYPKIPPELLMMKSSSCNNSKGENGHE